MVFGKFVDVVAAVEHVYTTVVICASIIGVQACAAVGACVEIIDMLLVITNGEEVHVGTGICGAVGSRDALCRVAYGAVASGINLLHEEMTPLRIGVCQILYGLEIGGYDSLLLFSERIGHNPSAVTVRSSDGVCPLVGIGIDAGACFRISFTRVIGACFVR